MKYSAVVNHVSIVLIILHLFVYRYVQNDGSPYPAHIIPSPVVDSRRPATDPGIPRRGQSPVSAASPRTPVVIHLEFPPSGRPLVQQNGPEVPHRRQPFSDVGGSASRTLDFSVEGGRNNRVSKHKTLNFTSAHSIFKLVSSQIYKHQTNR